MISRSQFDQSPGAHLSLLHTIKPRKNVLELRDTRRRQLLDECTESSKAYSTNLIRHDLSPFTGADYLQAMRPIGMQFARQRANYGHPGLMHGVRAHDDARSRLLLFPANCWVQRNPIDAVSDNPHRGRLSTLFFLFLLVAAAMLDQSSTSNPSTNVPSRDTASAWESESAAI